MASSSPWALTALLAALFIALLASVVFKYVEPFLPPEHQPVSEAGVTELVGGCAPFAVYAQNRYPPLGAKSRTAPSRNANDVESYAPNELISVDGWVRSRAAYPHNNPPFDSDVWYHVADGSGWVAFAAVRADPTVPAQDPFNPDGGRPAPLPEECSGTFR